MTSCTSQSVDLQAVHIRSVMDKVTLQLVRPPSPFPDYLRYPIRISLVRLLYVQRLTRILY